MGGTGGSGEGDGERRGLIERKFGSIEWRSVGLGAVVMAVFASYATVGRLRPGVFFVGGIVAGATAAFVGTRTEDAVGQAGFAVVLGGVLAVVVVVALDLSPVSPFGSESAAVDATTINTALINVGYAMFVAPFAGFAGLVVGGIRNRMNEKTEVDFLDD